MTSWRARFSGLTLIVVLVPSLAGADDFNDSVDAIFAQIDAATDPGCSVGVIAEGELIHRSGYGLANLELDVPLDGTQVHRIGSVSKQFTAFAVLLLAEEGKVDLEVISGCTYRNCTVTATPSVSMRCSDMLPAWQTMTMSPEVMTVRSREG